MNDLIKMITAQLNVSETQASGGAGAILGAAKKFLGEDFSEISKHLPNVEQMISAAPQASSSNLSGLVGNVLSAFGQGDNKLAGLAVLASQFKDLKLDSTMITQFLPLITQFLQQKGGDGAAQMLQKVISGLK